MKLPTATTTVFAVMLNLFFSACTAVGAQEKQGLKSIPTFAEVVKKLTGQETTENGSTSSASVHSTTVAEAVPEIAVWSQGLPEPNRITAMAEMERVLASSLACGDMGLKAIDNASQERIALIDSKVKYLTAQITNTQITEKELKVQIQQVLRLQPTAVDVGPEIDDIKHRIELARSNGTPTNTLSEILRRTIERQNANGRTRKHLSGALLDLNVAIERNSGKAEILQALVRLADAETILWQSFFMGRRAQLALDCSIREENPTYRLDMTPLINSAGSGKPE